jgi:hypothetical protein
LLTLARTHASTRARTALYRACVLQTGGAATTPTSATAAAPEQIKAVSGWPGLPLWWESHPAQHLTHGSGQSRCFRAPYRYKHAEPAGMWHIDGNLMRMRSPDCALRAACLYRLRGTGLQAHGTCKSACKWELPACALAPSRPHSPQPVSWPQRAGAVDRCVPTRVPWPACAARGASPGPWTDHASTPTGVHVGTRLARLMGQRTGRLCTPL